MQQTFEELLVQSESTLKGLEAHDYGPGPYRPKAEEEREAPLIVVLKLCNLLGDSPEGVAPATHAAFALILLRIITSAHTSTFSQTLSIRLLRRCLRSLPPSVMDSLLEDTEKESRASAVLIQQLCLCIGQMVLLPPSSRRASDVASLLEQRATDKYGDQFPTRGRLPRRQSQKQRTRRHKLSQPQEEAADDSARHQTIALLDTTAQATVRMALCRNIWNLASGSLSTLYPGSMDSVVSAMSQALARTGRVAVLNGTRAGQFSILQGVQ